MKLLVTNLSETATDLMRTAVESDVISFISPLSLVKLKILKMLFLIQSVHDLCKTESTIMWQSLVAMFSSLLSELYVSYFGFEIR